MEDTVLIQEKINREQSLRKTLDYFKQ